MSAGWRLRWKRMNRRIHPTWVRMSVVGARASAAPVAGRCRSQSRANQETPQARRGAGARRRIADFCSGGSTRRDQKSRSSMVRRSLIPSRDALPRIAASVAAFRGTGAWFGPSVTLKHPGGLGSYQRFTLTLLHCARRIGPRSADTARATCACYAAHPAALRARGQSRQLRC
jgi:hypothetical protein